MYRFGASPPLFDAGVVVAADEELPAPELADVDVEIVVAVASSAAATSTLASAVRIGSTAAAGVVSSGMVAVLATTGLMTSNFGWAFFGAGFVLGLSVALTLASPFNLCTLLSLSIPS